MPIYKNKTEVNKDKTFHTGVEQTSLQQSGQRYNPLNTGAGQQENQLIAAHSVSTLLDGRYLTYDEIDNEIILAHSLTTDKPLASVTKERRDSFRKKLEEVKTTHAYKSDIEKWKKQKGDFLAQKINELKLHEGVNRAYDPACLDTVLWYGRANNLTDDAMLTMLKRMKADDSGKLNMDIKARQIETVLSDILSWNMDDFVFSKTDDFLQRKEKGQGRKEHFLRLYSKLQVAKNAGRLLDELERIGRDCNAPLDFSKKTIDELKVRIKMYKLIEQDYAERLSIMSSPYYALLQQSDLEKAMTAKSDNALNSMKQGKSISGSRVKKPVPEEFKQYVDTLLLKKKRWEETRLSDVITRGSKAEKAIEAYLKKHNIDLSEREERLNSEILELRDAFAQNLTELKEQRKRIPVSKKKETARVERQKIDNSMRMIQGRSFIPMEKPDSRMGIFGKLKNIGLVGVRWMFGATAGTIGAIIGTLIGAPQQLKEKERLATAQKKRIHGIVPGTKDERYADERITDSDDEKDILFDIRRAPLVWERLSAGDPEEPPQITVMTSQSIRGSRLTTVEHIGHAMIGLSYSRFNKLTGKKERYKLTMGFYPGAGMNCKANSIMMAAGAVCAGRLRDDNKHVYDVARKYTVKPGDINRIIRASESYADGGYGYYKRNCATFVADMARLANLPIADETIQEEIGFTGTLSTAANIATGAAYSAYSMAANTIADKLGKKDLSYQYYGQKITTKEDLDRYYDTATKGDIIRKGYSPGAMGEDLRASDKGELTAFYDEHTEIDVLELQSVINAASDDLAEAIKSRLESQNIFGDEDRLIYGMLKEKLDFEGIIGTKGPDVAKKAKTSHKDIRSCMKNINTYYADRLKNDHLLNEKVMKYLSLCETVLTGLDMAYQENISNQYTGELASLYKDYKTHFGLTYRDSQIDISPDLYLGYLKSGKSPEQIVLEREELNRLVRIPSSEMTDEEYNRFQELSRNSALAMDFAYAGSFFLHKEDYTQKDIHYAFVELPKTEQAEKGKLTGEFITFNRPSLFFQAAILGKVFNGMSALDIADKDINARISMLDGFITARMKEHKDYMGDILSVYIEGKEKSDAAELTNVFFSEGLSSYIMSAIRSAGRSAGLKDKEVEQFATRIYGLEQTLQWIQNEINRLREQASNTGTI